MEESQLSVTVNIGAVGMALHSTVSLGGNTSLNDGATESIIVKVAIVEVALPHGSVAVKVTVAEPVVPQRSLRLEKSFDHAIAPQSSEVSAPALLFNQLLQP